MIHLKEVIAAINSTDQKGNGLEFSIEFVTSNKQKKTEGRRSKLLASSQNVELQEVAVDGV